VRQRDTAAELRVRAALHRRGMRFRVDTPPIGGRRRADIVFTRARVAVYIHGCYWHLCPQHATFPKANSDWWRQKLEANRERDRRTNAELAEQGWVCLTFWEHEEPERVADVIERAVRERL
jgi:DNA mismatch endonuclease (patch repair protein)